MHDVIAVQDVIAVRSLLNIYEQADHPPSKPLGIIIAIHFSVRFPNC